MTGKELHTEYKSHLQNLGVSTSRWSDIQKHIQKAWSNLAESLDQRAGAPIVTDTESKHADTWEI